MTIDRDALIRAIELEFENDHDYDSVYDGRPDAQRYADAVIAHLSAVPVEGDRAHLARSIVNQVLGGAVECGAYDLADMKKRQEYNDVADAFVARLLPALPVEGEVEWRRISPKGTPVTWPLKTHPGEEPGWTVERRAVVRGPWEVTP